MPGRGTAGLPTQTRGHTSQGQGGSVGVWERISTQQVQLIRERSRQQRRGVGPGVVYGVRGSSEEVPGCGKLALQLASPLGRRNRVCRLRRGKPLNRDATEKGRTKTREYDLHTPPAMAAIRSEIPSNQQPLLFHPDQHFLIFRPISQPHVAALCTFYTY
ncbi:hypothetical protein AAFF_G00199220 [Aldrovandia affinis]|uniref:Uncharacterized protein n=1 Tax=Aldrovandia affinis TaxID=143900 RepID=A0AAD7W577_9TELE|nr:hypothetical protein AAFF_G00199220 [Aldrovandia affinis]